MRRLALVIMPALLGWQQDVRPHETDVVKFVATTDPSGQTIFAMDYLPDAWAKITRGSLFDESHPLSQQAQKLVSDSVNQLMRRDHICQAGWTITRAVHYYNDNVMLYGICDNPI